MIQFCQVLCAFIACGRAHNPGQGWRREVLSCSVAREAERLIGEQRCGARKKHLAGVVAHALEDVCDVRDLLQAPEKGEGMKLPHAYNNRLWQNWESRPEVDPRKLSVAI